LGQNRPDPKKRLIILPLHAKYLLHTMATGTRKEWGRRRKGGPLDASR